MKSHTLRPFLLMAALLLPLQASSAGEVRVLTAGAFKQVVLALVPDFEKQTGSKVIVDNDTAPPPHTPHRRLFLGPRLVDCP